jgi:hypothetical protein
VADSAEAQESQGMEKRELDVVIAVGALQPYPCTIIMRCRRIRGGERPRVAVMRNRLTVQTHIGEGGIDSKQFVTSGISSGGGRVRRGGGGVLQTAAFYPEIGFRISLCALALQLGPATGSKP